MHKLTKYKFNKLYEMSSGISSKPEQAGHGSPFASFSTVFNNYFLPDELPDLMDVSEQEQETYSIKNGDILLTRTSETIDELAMSCVALKDFPKATFSGFTKRIRPTQTDVTYPKYMGFYLRSNFFRRTMTNNAVMTLRASLNEDIFSYLDLLLPDFDTQKKIGDFLYLLDDKIKINNRINTELEAMAKTIYNYWFIQFDFPNEEGKPYKASGGEMEYNEKLKMEIPVGWTDGKLSEVANITMGQSPDGDSYNEEGEGMVFFQGSTDFNFRFPLVRMFTTAPSRIAQEEDVLLSVRAPVGTLNVANEKCCIGRGLAALNSKNEANSFVLYLMFYFKAMFDVQDRTGTTFGSIDKDTLHDLKFAKPPVELQKQFQSIVGKYDKMILTRSRETQELITLRDFLLPLLMNGQVKLV
ncbi:MAG: restriction endonuclease subunit S [Bacteroidia bacterium]|nr:restriction endonuclease subunit S [Bacteroidia bacterium]MCC7513750.1 restriction endonuclease subunit S [Bacteroidia bacterium]HMU77649.1 restriction endonuclease subunit S [Bacteroidia bacterium]HMX96299.1 restriction endonuclease subunit S [Bacteroidia bacterium]HMY62918.1 restriction endonuclease subunit S [Bacteroidia bacterium]